MHTRVIEEIDQDRRTLLGAATLGVAAWQRGQAAPQLSQEKP